MVIDVNNDATVIREIKSSEFENLKAEGIIAGGMIPKLEAIKYAMQNGLNEAVLLDGRMKNSLIFELFTSEGFGTLIKKDNLDLTKYKQFMS